MSRRDNALLWAPIAQMAELDRPAPSVDQSRRELDRRPAPPEVIDVLTIGDKTTVCRPVQRALMGSGWAVRHADSVESAVRLLETNRAAVAVIEADHGWVDMLSSLRSLPEPPAVVVVTYDDLAVMDAPSLGAHDLLRRPLNSADLLWSIATAWHAWMKRFEEKEGGG